MTPAVKKPCAECPFRVGGPAGWMGTATPEAYAADIINDARMPCHMTVDYEDPDWHRRWIDSERGSLCAGALVMMSNIVKRTRDKDRPVVPADRVTVYPTLTAMIDAHRGASVRSWQVPDNDPQVAEVRERLRMAPIAPADVSCAHEGCRNPVGPDDHCAGCDEYVCEEHSTNHSLMGHGHDVSEHWTPEDETDDDW